MEILPLRKAERWFLAATIFVVIAYSWLLARALEPRIFAPRSVVAEIVWLSHGEAVDGRDPAIRHSPAAIGLRRELTWMHEALKFLGSFQEAPVLVISTDEKERALVGDERVIISSDLAASEGQVLKALLKAWLYQNAAVEVTSSYLRVEAASEFLCSVVRGGERAPGVADWLSFASSFDSSRADSANWGSAELRRFAGRSPNMNPLAFKPLLTGMLWEMYQQTPRLQRFKFLRAWTRSLRWPSTSEMAAAKAPPETLAEWRHWLLAEFDGLSAGLGEIRRPVIARAGLAEAPSVRAWFARDNAKLALANLAEASAQPTVIESGADELWLVNRTPSGLPAWIKLSVRDRSELRARQYIWEGCEPIRLGELLERSQGAEHLLYISSCDKENATESGWRAFLTGGLREFARTRPEVPFLQLKRSAVEVALRQGKLDRGDKVGKFLSLNLNPVFGIQSAQWSRDLHAYRLLGAIEAFEWIRGSPFAAALYN